MDLDEKQEKFLKKAFYATWIAAGIIGFALLMISYSNAPEEIPAPAITIDALSASAHKVENARGPVTYNDISYGQDIDFAPTAVRTLSFFKKDKTLDKVDFSVDYKGYSSQVSDYFKATLFVRGIKYDELPKVYYYKEELSFWSNDNDIGVFSWYRGGGISGLSVSENPPWIVTANYYKDGLGISIVLSAIVGGVIGLIVAAILELIGAVMLLERNALKPRTPQEIN